MKLTILGCHGPYPPAGGACSGYLLEHENNFILLDCGNGVLSKLQYHIEINRLTAVFVSHLHSDHMADLLIMRYALQIDLEQGKRSTALKIFTPAEPAAELERLSYKEVYEIETIEENAFEFASLKFSFTKTAHPVSCYAMRIEKPEGKAFVYSADTAFFPGIIPFAEAADLFLCEANFLQADLEANIPHYHLSASQAAGIAREAGVQRLLLTHLPPHRKIGSYLAEAQTVFPKAALAEEGKSYSI